MTPLQVFQTVRLEKMIGRRSRYLSGPGKCSGALLVLVDSRVSGNIPVSFLGAILSSFRGVSLFFLSLKELQTSKSQPRCSGQKLPPVDFRSSQERHPNFPRHQRLKLRECSELNQMEMGRGSGSGELKVELKVCHVFLFEP